MQIQLVNNDGGGFSKMLEVAEGTTIGEFFAAHVGGEPKNYKIRVDRQAVMSGQVLTEGQRVTITPNKIEGA